MAVGDGHMTDAELSIDDSGSAALARIAEVIEQCGDDIAEDLKSGGSGRNLVAASWFEMLGHGIPNLPCSVLCAGAGFAPK
jgi:hypothetical protein